MENKTTQPENGITLLGLGPGALNALTREAWDWILTIDTLYLRTMVHPIVDALPSGLKLISFDEVLTQIDAQGDPASIVEEKIVELAQQKGGVTYAVPGHPLVAEATCQAIIRRAEEAGISYRVIDGLSFLEPTFRALGVNPVTSLSLVDGLALSGLHTADFSPANPALITQITSVENAAAIKKILLETYPMSHPVRWVHAAGTDQESVETLALDEMDQSKALGQLSSLYLPGLAPNSSFESFMEVIARLRAPDGCPWDRAQTHMTLRPYLIEEAYEALDALDRGDLHDLAEELGDMLLQIGLHAQIGVEQGEFTINDVIEGISTKLIRRHPHVFSSVEVEDVSGVIQNWEAIKENERRDNGESSKKGLLDGVPRALPALLQAEEIVERVGRVKFDELTEMGQDAVVRSLLVDAMDATGEARQEKLGALLLALASYAHQQDIGAEDALREAINRFRKQFDTMEADALAAGQSLVDLSDEEKDQLWAEAGSQDKED
jgi:tetrapyrrole methylase family protein/MazG family protein